MNAVGSQKTPEVVEGHVFKRNPPHLGAKPWCPSKVPPFGQPIEWCWPLALLWHWESPHV